MRRANSSGSIFKMKGAKRRKPWRVRITKGWELDPATGKSKQVVVNLGYYATRSEAEAALVAYNECPYDIKEKDITFADVYEKWSEAYFKELKGKNSQRTITSVYSYCHLEFSRRVSL